MIFKIRIQAEQKIVVGGKIGLRKYWKQLRMRLEGGKGSGTAGFAGAPCCLSRVGCSQGCGGRESVPPALLPTFFDLIYYDFVFSQSFPKLKQHVRIPMGVGDKQNIVTREERFGAITGPALCPPPGSPLPIRRPPCVSPREGRAPPTRLPGGARAAQGASAPRHLGGLMGFAFSSKEICLFQYRHYHPPPRPNVSSKVKAH